MTFTAEFEVPEGYELAGEYRVPEIGEWYVSPYGDANHATLKGKYPRAILRPTPKWRPATVEDAIRALRGETVKARFRDCPDKNWRESNLTGMVSQLPYPWGSTEECYRFCEVLDV